MTALPAPRASGRASLPTQVRILTERLLDEVLASPTLLGGTLLFAVGFVVLQDGLLGGSQAIAGEVGGDYLTFVVPAGLLIAAVASGMAGFALAQDMEDRYLERLLTMPVSVAAIVLAPVLLGAAVAAVQATLVLVVGAILGASPATGFPGAAVMVALTMLWSMGLAGYMVTVGLLTGRLEFVRLADLGAFPLLFLSPLLLPREDLKEWVQAIAAVNPTTYAVEGLRALMSEGWDGGAIAAGFAASAGFAAVTLATAAWAARARTGTR